MNLHVFRLKSFLSYWLEAVDAHSLHSPFFFDFYTRVIKAPPQAKKFEGVERLRKKLLRDDRIINVTDLGSAANAHAARMISRIAGTSLSTPRFSSLFHRMVEYCGATSIVELGTSLGINTLYLAEDWRATVTTFEGAPAVADIASLTFEFAGKKNIRLIVGNIDNTLPAFMQETARVDFAFIDANHRYQPTLRYFECLLKKTHDKSVVVIDDIHYSPEMQRAWEVIREHRLVYGTADLFRCGIAFFDPSLNKQHVILQV